MTGTRHTTPGVNKTTSTSTLVLDSSLLPPQVSKPVLKLSTGLFTTPVLQLGTGLFTIPSLGIKTSTSTLVLDSSLLPPQV